MSKKKNTTIVVAYPDRSAGNDPFIFIYLFIYLFFFGGGWGLGVGEG